MDSETAAAVSTGEPQTERAQRWLLLARLELWLEKPMIVLGAIWFALVVVELVWSSSPGFDLLGTAIWIVFIAEFLLRFILAPEKLQFLRGNLITLLALLAPGLRFLRAFRLLRAARGLRLVRIVGTANRSIAVLRSGFALRGLAYVLGATVAVMLLGAAGMLALEPATQVDGGFRDYADALWWTAMLISTMGSGYWPQTLEGRLLTVLLSLYGLAVFGYITASLATFFIGQEAKSRDGAVAGAADLDALRCEIGLLREELRSAGTSIARRTSMGDRPAHPRHTSSAPLPE